LLQRVDEVDSRALEVLGARRVDDDADAVVLELGVVARGAAVETELVLEPAAASTLDRHAQHLGLAGRLLRHELAHLDSRGLGEGDACGLSRLDTCHRKKCTDEALRTPW